MSSQVPASASENSLFSQKHIRELDGLRGIACLLVVSLHMVFGIVEIPEGSAWSEIRIGVQPFLVGGVDLFFVLSGFLIGGILLDNKGSPRFFRAFWTRRISRIFPVYYLLFISFLVVIWTRSHFGIFWMDAWLLEDLSSVWPYPLFVQNMLMAFDGKFGPRFIGITWSLSIEEQFYLLLPPTIFLLKRRPIFILAIVCIIAAPIIRTVVWQSTASWVTSYVLLPCRMDGLMWGVAVTCIIRTPGLLNRLRAFRPLLDLLAFSLALAVTMGTFEYWGIKSDANQWPGKLLVTLKYSAVAAFFGLFLLRIFLVSHGNIRRFLGHPILVFFGSISYALYMYHQGINGILHGLIHESAPVIRSPQDWALSLLGFALAVFLSKISLDLMENPIRRIGRKIRY